MLRWQCLARGRLRPCWVALVVAAAGFVPGLLSHAAGPSAEEAARPNVVLIVADDLGWRDVGYHGSEIRTPVLDRLAAESVRFDRWYVYPTCSPTRACLLSGRNAARFGIKGPVRVGSPLGLPASTTTLAELLKQRGYATALVGKWHLGAGPGTVPRKQGFDEFYGYLHGQVDHYTHLFSAGEPIWLRNETLIREQGHATDLFTREAVAFIRKHVGVRRRPFFLDLSFSVPHYPVQADPAWYAMYERRIADKERRGVAAMVSHMDAAVGRVLAALDETGVRDNTLVVFTSDNGGQQSWPHTKYGGRHGPYRRLGDNSPLRGWKGELYEGAVRVVGMAHWRGRLKPGVLKGVAHAVDLFPTVAGRTGGPAPASLRLEGIDLWPALTGRSQLPLRTFHWDVGGRVGLLDGDYKLILIRRARMDRKLGEPPVALFNLAKDPLEKRNLAPSDPARAARLQAKLAAELRRDKGSANR